MLGSIVLYCGSRDNDIGDGGDGEVAGIVSEDLQKKSTFQIFLAPKLVKRSIC